MQYWGAFELALEHLLANRVTGSAVDSEIWDLLALLVREIPSCTFVVNGLDDCARASDKRRDFLVQLKRAVRHTAMRMLVVSRYKVDIRAEPAPSGDDGIDEDQHDSRHYEQGPSHVNQRIPTSSTSSSSITRTELCVSEDDVHDDIAHFTRSVIDQHLPNKAVALWSDVAMQMAGKCAGMFLWINLQ
jgi:hypothetical protein